MITTWRAPGLPNPRAGIAFIGFCGVLMWPIPAGIAVQTVAAEEPLLTIQAQNEPVQAALQQIFTAAHQQYRVDASISGSVSMQLTNVPFTAALRVVMSSVNPRLQMKLVDGVYHITQPAPAVVKADLPAPAAPVDRSAQPAGGNGRFYRMQIYNTDAAIIAELMQKLGRSGSVILVPAGTPNASNSQSNSRSNGSQSGMSNQNGTPNNASGTPNNAYAQSGATR